MNHPNFHKHLAHAGIASMGGRRQGINAVTRSRRQRQRAYEKEATKLLDAWQRAHPEIRIPDDEDDLPAFQASCPEFAQWCEEAAATPAGL